MKPKRTRHGGSTAVSFDLWRASVMLVHGRDFRTLVRLGYGDRSLFVALPNFHPRLRAEGIARSVADRVRDRWRLAHLWLGDRLGWFECAGLVQNSWGRTVTCGSWVAGSGKEFCRNCQRRYELLYPQGWRYYPGDVCPHGRYVGGCGVDWICGKCELD